MEGEISKYQAATAGSTLCRYVWKAYTLQSIKIIKITLY